LEAVLFQSPSRLIGFIAVKSQIEVGVAPRLLAVSEPLFV